MKSQELYDPIRKIHVAPTPEECVRQNLLSQMIEKLGYPKGLICVEKNLATIGSTYSNPPDRRIDILCLTNALSDDGNVKPLLMIECKAIHFSRKTVEQVLGYNHHIEALYVALANQRQVILGWLDNKTKEYRFTLGLPSYNSLLRSYKDGTIPKD